VVHGVVGEAVDDVVGVAALPRGQEGADHGVVRR
jgi:hypothetical protein